MYTKFPILILFTLLLLITAHAAFAQEICDNGKDDDGDGLVDLKDPDCNCSFRVTGNLLKNGSFESFKHCPSNYYDNDFRIADYWEYGTYTNYNEANYYHNFKCSNDSSQLMLFIPPSLPLPDGEAFVSIRQYIPKKPGLVETDIAKTYIGQCLQTSLNPGEQYTLSFSAGRFKSYDDRDYKYKTVPFTVAVFGHRDCNAVPFGKRGAKSNGCPTNYDGWTLLGKTQVYSKGRWVQNRIDFTVPSAINVIEIGLDCSIVTPDFDLPDTTTFSDFYTYYLDDVHLLATKDFHFAYIQGSIGNTCQVDSILTAPNMANASYQWYKDSIAITGATKNTYHLQDNNRTGNYNVRISNADTCFISEPLAVGLSKLSSLSIPKDTSFCVNDSLILAPSLNGVTYTSNGRSSSFVTITRGGTYNIVATDAKGCTKTFNVAVSAEDCTGIDLFMPNAFTPNGDGKNDLFRIPRQMKMNVKEFSVFNRLGNKVFSTTSRGTGWDGMFHGVASPAGTYVYLIKGTVNNRNKQIKGTVLLIR